MKGKPLFYRMSAGEKSVRGQCVFYHATHTSERVGSGWSSGDAEVCVQCYVPSCSPYKQLCYLYSCPFLIKLTPMSHSHRTLISPASELCKYPKSRINLATGIPIGD